MTTAGPSSELVDPGAAAGVRAADVGLPAVFGRYLLVQRISRGGMGEIFLAKHGLAGFEKLCVIKKVLPSLAEDDQFISRFIDEAQVAIKLQHVNVAQVFEVGRVGDEYFLALEYIDGRDLRRTLHVLQKQGRRFPAELALFVGREMANGLAYAHRRTGADGTSLGLVHCDISPPNVVVSFEGETKIIDFGIAKSALRATSTDPKMGFGKFGYMAPEQLIRGGVVDHRTDIYATGVVLFELLTGERLYEVSDNPDYKALARQVVKGEHRLPSQIDPALADFDALVARALRPRPDERYQTAAELRDALQQAVVQLAPTISTDALGAFLRDVFATEMRQQRELLDRAAATHLSDFEQQLETQAVATVTFAQSPLAPAPPPPVTARPRPATAPPPLPSRAARVTGSVRPLTASATAPAPASVPLPLPPIGDAGVDDGVPLVELTTRGRTGRRWWPFVLLGAGVIAVVIVLAAGGDDGSPAPPAPVVVSLDVDAAVAAGPPVDAGVAVAVDAAPARPDDRVVRAGSGAGSGSGSSSPRRAIDAGADEPAAPDAAALRAKFSATSREYRAYKERMGDRLEAEWTDLLTRAGYLSTPEKRIAFDKAIDRFRAAMKQ
jgi:serine/threonine protein kinase